MKNTLNSTHVPKRILALGLWIQTSGLTRVLHNVLTKVADDHEVTLVGVGYKGPPYQEGNLKIVPCNLQGGDMWGARQVEEMIEAQPPDALFVLGDFPVLPIYDRLIKKVSPQLPTIAYLPMDGHILNPARKKILPPFTHIVSYCDFGTAEIERILTAQPQTEPTYSKPQLSSMPHGIDIKEFFPMSAYERQSTFEKWFGKEMGAAEEAFIVLNANRPSFRKRIDLTLEGFALFAKGKPENVKLYLHHARTRSEERKQILGWIEQFGLQDRVLMNPVLPRSEFLTDAELNELYNLCKVGLNTSMAEGWGLVSFEHAATGAAQIVPDHTACGELWRGCAQLLPSEVSHEDMNTNFYLKAVTPQSIAQALERYYTEPDFRKTQAKAGYKMVTQPKFEWKNIQTAWQMYFEKVLDSNRKKQLFAEPSLGFVGDWPIDFMDFNKPEVR